MKILLYLPIINKNLDCKNSNVYNIYCARNISIYILYFLLSK